jgi:long-chain fatty acid transport protein
MMWRTVALRASLTLAAAGLLAGTGMAQTDVEINAAVQFNFTSPGARSLALGGAFIGLADDATAAFTNPAGLTTLTKPEISAEGRRFQYSNLFTSGGRLGGTPTRTGVDTVSGLVDGELKDDVNDLSFASIVYPRGRFAVAAYRHEVANFKANLQSEGAFFGDSRIRPVQADMDLTIVNYGLSMAYRFGEGVSLGAGVSLYDFKLSSTTRRYDFQSGGTGTGGFYGPPLFASSNNINTQTQDGDTTAVGFNVGVSVKSSEKVRWGAVYRKGPKFDFDVVNRFGPASSFPNTVVVQGTASFHVPDAYGAGLSIRATESLTVALDYQRVQYSQLTDDFVTLFPSSLPRIPASPVAKSGYVADDSNQFHAGIEYVFTSMKSPLAVRLGAWNDPDHRIRFTGSASDSDTALFRQGDDDFHVSGGLGIVVGGNFQIDAAYDYSDRVKTGSVSAVLRF